MTWFRVGGAGIPAALKNAMNAVFNKKFGTSGQNYPPKQWPDDVNLLGPLPEGTASGSIAHITDGADGVPIKSCEVALSASLDGYSSVDVVSTGKNLLDESTIQNGYQINATSGFPTAWNGRCATTTPITIHGGNITVSYSSTDSLVRLMYSFFKNGTFIERVSNIASGTTINAQDYDEMYIGFANVNGVAITKDVLSDIQIEVGSTATTYEPYTAPTVSTVNLGRTIYGGVPDVVNGNCEPINWLDVPAREEMTRNNVVSSIASDGTITASGQSTGNGDIPVTLGTSINLTGGETYTFSIIGTDTRTGSIYVYFAGGSYISINNSNHSGTYTPSADQTITGITLRMFNGQSITLEAKIQLEKGTTAHDYSPYFEPFTFTPITPTPETALGVNNFWADEGDTTVVYRRDIDLALQAVSSSRGLMMASRPVTQMVGEESDPDQVNELVENDEIEQEGEDDAR